MKNRPEKPSLTRRKLEADLAQLVALPTVTGQPEGFAQAIDFLQKQLSPHAKVDLITSQPEPILLAANHDTLQPDVCFLVHIDVVSGKPEQFTMQISDDIAYGRGVSDMKYAAVLGYSLLNDLLAQDSELKYTLAITCDEERGGFAGAGFLADSYGLKPKLVIVPDGGDNFVLINQSKGVCKMQIKTVGTPAHASTPHLGVNALQPIVELSHRLFAEYETANSKPGNQTTLNQGLLQGGINSNQVPASALLELDFRFSPSLDSAPAIEASMKKMAAEINPALEVLVTKVGVAAEVDLAHPVLVLFQEIMTSHLGQTPTVAGTPSSHDGRHFNKHGVPFIMTKPVGGDIHGDNEHINLTSTMQYYYILREFLSCCTAYL